MTDFSGIINPYMNYGSYGNYGGYGSFSGLGGSANYISDSVRGTRVRKDHTLTIKDSDSAHTRAMKEAINRVNAAGTKAQDTNSVESSGTKTADKEEKWTDLNKALRKMDKNDLMELYSMMRTAIESGGRWGGLF